MVIWDTQRQRKKFCDYFQQDISLIWTVAITEMYVRIPLDLPSTLWEPVI